MTTIGERLLAQTAERERQAKLAEEVKARKKREQDEQDAGLIRTTLERAKDEVITAVDENRPVKPIKAKNRAPFVVNGKTPDSSEHPHHVVYREFLPWADSQGVEVQMRHAHDGMGMDSWIEVSFQAKPAQ